MSHSLAIRGSWPRLMRAETAAVRISPSGGYFLSSPYQGGRKGRPMAMGRSRRGDRRSDRPPRRERRVVKPESWPRYMREKRLSAGTLAYFWEPQTGDKRRGWPVHAEALGTDYAVAVERARLLNQHQDACGASGSVASSPPKNAADTGLWHGSSTPISALLCGRRKSLHGHARNETMLS